MVTLLSALSACSATEEGAAEAASLVDPGAGGIDSAAVAPDETPAQDEDAGADASDDDIEEAAPEEPTGCTPGPVTCSGPTTVEICQPDGIAIVETDCPPGFGCLDADCVPQICNPGVSSGQCLPDGDSYERCNMSGTAYEVIPCGEAAYCYLGACIQQLCEPGTKICKSFVQLQVCDESGEAWIDAEMCPTGGSCSAGACLTPCEVNVKDGSYLGCEYWAADLDNVGDAKGKVIGIVVSVPANGGSTEVKITNNATGMLLSAAQLGVASTMLGPGQLGVFHLPLGFDVDGSVLTERTFKIETDTPVAVHQFNPLNGEGVHTNDASLLLPSKVTGQEYFVMSWPHRIHFSGVLRGFMTIVATQPGQTNIVVRPSSPVVPVNGISALTPGQDALFTLNQGQMLNLETDGEHGDDLTGSYVWADKKISVIGGHECANVPLGIDNCDHLEQQLYPLETWSFEYVLDAFKPRSAGQVDVWRVMAGDNDVTVYIRPALPGHICADDPEATCLKLQRGGWWQFASGASHTIDSDGPLMVGHYLSGSTYPGSQLECVDEATGTESAIGDPAFTLAVPVKRYLRNYTVLTPEGYQQNYLNIVVPTGATVSIDGQPLPPTVPVVPIPGSNYGLARAEVEPGIHTVTGNAPIGLTAYGYDCDVSYAYPGGMKLQAIED